MEDCCDEGVLEWCSNQGLLGKIKNQDDYFGLGEDVDTTLTANAKKDSKGNVIKGDGAGAGAGANGGNGNVITEGDKKGLEREPSPKVVLGLASLVDTDQRPPERKARAEGPVACSFSRASWRKQRAELTT